MFGRAVRRCRHAHRASTSAARTMDDSGDLRALDRRRPVLAVAARPDRDRPVAMLSSRRTSDETEIFRYQLRHAVLTREEDARDDWPPAPRAPGRARRPRRRAAPARRARRGAGAEAARGRRRGRSTISGSCAMRRRRAASASRSRPAARPTRRRSAKQEQRLHEADKELARQRTRAVARGLRREAARVRAGGRRGPAPGAGAAPRARQRLGAGARRGQDALIEVVTSIAEERGFNLVLPSSAGPALLAPDRRHRRGAGASSTPSCLSVTVPAAAGHRLKSR